MGPEIERASLWEDYECESCGKQFTIEGNIHEYSVGARTIGQDESTCVVYGMPKVAYDIGAVEYQEKLYDIARKTYSVLNAM